MNLHNRPDKSNNNNITTKAIAAIPIAGISVAAVLLLGLLSLIGSGTAIAQQQNMTGTNVTSMNATAGNVTSMNATAGNATAGNATAGNVTG